MIILILIKFLDSKHFLDAEINPLEFKTPDVLFSPSAEETVSDNSFEKILNVMTGKMVMMLHGAKKEKRNLKGAHRYKHLRVVFVQSNTEMHTSLCLGALTTVIFFQRQLSKARDGVVVGV